MRIIVEHTPHAKEYAVTTTAARTRNVPTTRMRADELARVWAAQHGIVGRAGGWLYTATGRPVCHGWGSLAASLRRQGIVIEGAGVEWRRTDLVGADRVIARVIAERTATPHLRNRRAGGR